MGKRQSTNPFKQAAAAMETDRIQQRLALIQTLSSLPGPQFEQLIFSLEAPRGNLGGPSAAQGERAPKLLEWAESPVGCGLETLEQVLNSIIQPTIAHSNNADLRSQGLIGVSDRSTPGDPSADNRQSGPSASLNDAASHFITGTPISQPRRFFGRQRVLKRLFNLLKTHPLQNAAIIGQRRSGKTSLLNYLRHITQTPQARLRPGQKSDWLPQPETYRWIFVDFQDSRMASQERVLSFLLEAMELPAPSPCNLDRFMDEVSSNLNSPTVILMDEIGVGLQRCPELDDAFWESLRALATNQVGGNLAFVLATPQSPVDLAHHTGHSSPFFNIFGYTTMLAPLTEMEARELIASSPIPFPNEDVEWILSQSNRWPILLQILCRERLFSLEEGEIGDDWREEGLQQLEPFTHLLKG